jgi:hypothetical protein
MLEPLWASKNFRLSKTHFRFDGTVPQIPEGPVLTKAGPQPLDENTLCAQTVKPVMSHRIPLLALKMQTHRRARTILYK